MPISSGTASTVAQEQRWTSSKRVCATKVRQRKEDPKKRWSYNSEKNEVGSCGGMCERLKQAVLKTAVLERVPGVRIPLPPPLTSLVGNYLAASTALPAASSGSRLEHNRSTLR